MLSTHQNPPETKESPITSEKTRLISNLEFYNNTYSDEIKRKSQNESPYCCLNLFSQTYTKKLKDLKGLQAIIAKASQDSQVPAIVLAYKIRLYLKEIDSIFNDHSLHNKINQSLINVNHIMPIFCTMMLLQKEINDIGMENGNFPLKCQLSYLKQKTFEDFSNVEQYEIYKKQFDTYFEMIKEIQNINANKNKNEIEMKTLDLGVPVRKWY